MEFREFIRLGLGLSLVRGLVYIGFWVQGCRRDLQGPSKGSTGLRILGV